MKIFYRGRFYTCPISELRHPCLTIFVGAGLIPARSGNFKKTMGRHKAYPYIVHKIIDMKVAQF
jgi:hypothetical protein